MESKKSTEIELFPRFSEKERNALRQAMESLGALGKENDSIARSAIQCLDAMRLDCVTMEAAALAIPLEQKTVALPWIQREFGDSVWALCRDWNAIAEAKSKLPENRKTIGLNALLLSFASNPKFLLMVLALESNRLDHTRTETPDGKNAASLAMDVFAPLAEKLGLHAFKNALEDNAFRILQPQAFQKIENALSKKQWSRVKELDEFQKSMESLIEKHRISAKVFTRVKHAWSVFNKLQRNEINGLEDISDLIAVRLVCDSEKECYELLGLVNENWKTVPEKFFDYIAKPKPNGYQSIHLKAIGYRGKPIEVQIRTWTMHYIAEEGIAAHWKYKGIRESGQDRQLHWLKEAMEWNQKIGNNGSDWSDIQFDSKHLIVFTPTGDALSLPEGSTPIDFAYEIHSSLGHHCEKAKVNGVMVPLHHALHRGDWVEVTPSMQQKPKTQWLSWVKSPKAKAKIRHAVGMRATEEKRVLIPKETKPIQWIEGKALEKAQPGKCCQPIPGEALEGFFTTKRKISIHRLDCPNLQKTANEKRFPVGWKNIASGERYTINLQVIALDRDGLLAELLQSLNQNQCKVLQVNAKQEQQQAVCQIDCTVTNASQLQQAMEGLQSVRGVQRVERKPNNKE